MSETDQSNVEVVREATRALARKFDNNWYIATHIGESYLPPGRRTITPFVHPRGVSAYIDFLKSAFNAEVEIRAEHGGVVRHARLTIGNGAQLAARSGIMHDVPAREIWAGLPAKPIGQAMREIAYLSRLVRKKGRTDDNG